jgi:quinol monooxygenase YgiN
MTHDYDNHLVMLAEFDIKPDLLASFLDYTVENLTMSRAFPGNIAFDILVDETHPTAVRFYEIWESAQAQQTYMAWRVGQGDLNRLMSYLAGPPKFVAMKSIAAPRLAG